MKFLRTAATMLLIALIGATFSPSAKGDPSGEELELAQVVKPPPAAEMQVASVPEAASLPQTVSSVPLIGLLGLVALGGFVSLRLLENRIL